MKLVTYHKNRLPIRIAWGAWFEDKYGRIKRNIIITFFNRGFTIYM